MTVWDFLSTDENTDIPSEAILNVLRETDDPVMGTQEIADIIRMSRQGAQNRLETLEADDKVESKKVGETWVWVLHHDERRDPIPPEIDRMVRVFDRVRALIRPSQILGGFILAIGFALLYAGVTGVLVDLQNPVIGNNVLTVLGWGTVLTGASTWLIGGGIIYGTLVVDRFAEWRLRNKRLSNQAADSGRNSKSRGQSLPRLLLGMFLLVLVGGPLLNAGVQFQAGLASMPAFSPFEAFAVAALFILAVVAAILGLDSGR